MRYIFLLSLPLYALDQVTKWWVRLNIRPEDAQIPVVPQFFYLVNVVNNGAAFGSFKNNNTFFIFLSCAAFIFVLFLLLRPKKPTELLREVSLALLLAGVMGNLTDRLVHGHVIDFLLFDLHVPLAHPWPAFNVADSCICIAVVCFIIDSFRKPTSAVEERVAPQD